MKNSALPVTRIASLFAIGTIAILVSSGALAATTVVISPEQQKLILKDPGTAVLGSQNPDVTVVEYFDYNCPFCRKLAPSIHALVDKDHKVAVLFKEWPIFGGISVYAARSALASQWQGKYLAAHDALISAPASRRKHKSMRHCRKPASMWWSSSGLLRLTARRSMPYSPAVTPRRMRWECTEPPAC